ncbi:MAG: ribosomal protein L13e [Desulfurococcales archaeon]|nr:ribosomal protein L13e [Desulfurococcales archaeon]MEB3845683.1 ribosomal protein L13e [Desulfurococcales archaeon]
MIRARVKKPVLLKHGGIWKGWRYGKGFSKGELSEAGLTIKKALKLGIPVDPRRRSVHPENVETLKAVLQEKG